MRQRMSSPVRAPTRRTGPAILALLMAFMVLTLACEEAQGFSAAGAVVASPEAELLQRSLELTDELQSFRAHVDMDMKVQGRELPMSFDMLKATNGRIHLVMDMEALASGMRMEMILADEGMFTNLPSVGWLRMDASTMSGLLGQTAGMDDPMGLFNNLFPSGDLPPDLYSVQSLGIGKVDGVTTQHLLILMDFDKIWGEMGKSSKGPFSQLMSLSGQSGQGDLGVNEIEVWIDQEGYNRRTVMKIALSENSSVDFDMRMSGFGDDINIDIPANYAEVS